MGGRDFLFPKNVRGKKIPNNLHHSLKRVPCILSDVLYKYPLRLDRAYYHIVYFLGMFPHGFSDCANVPLPCLCTLFQTIMFGMVVPDITAKITCTRVHLKTVIQTKQFSGFKIVWMHNQYFFEGLG